jgi:hypothetical protein
MKTIVFLCMGLFSLLLGHAQTPNNPIKPEQEITKLMNDWMIAVLKRDFNTLNKLVAPEFKLHGASKADFDRPVVTRETWMMNGRQKLKVDSVHYYKMNVDIIDNVAVVKSTFYWSGSFQGKAFIDSTNILIDTWLKRKEGWQVVSRIRVD